MPNSPSVPNVKQTILDDIVAHKRNEVEQAKKLIPYSHLEKRLSQASKIRGFAHALQNSDIGLIAEIKKASPSKGVISDNFAPDQYAHDYEHSGASCLSVLTDSKFFMGSATDFRQARSACTLPMLRKDFMLEPYQILESRAMGADCVLLIVACLTEEKLRQLYQFARDLGMDVLVETHNLTELELALSLPDAIIGINNRNLKNFSVSLNVTLSLLQYIPDTRILVTESGISGAADVDLMLSNNVKNFLIGEQFMRTEDPGLAVKTLLANF